MRFPGLDVCRIGNKARPSVFSAGADESYESNAVKEIQEEMGVKGVTLRHHFDFWHVRAAVFV